MKLFLMIALFFCVAMATGCKPDGIAPAKAGHQSTKLATGGDTTNYSGGQDNPIPPPHK